MYLHIVPKLFHRMANKCTLKSISIPELDLIIDGESLSVGRPWPNKCLWVGMRKSRKAVNGLLLHTDKKLRWFTTRYTWDIEDMGLIHHQVNTYIEDNEFDMVSQEILLNGSFDKWSDRVHSAYEGKPPAIIQPKMESFLKRPGEDSHDFSLFKRQPSIESALVI
ncbi:TPA: hypothetical protein R4082_004789 [Escherichia coli]|nr:hypothetical protein [Escherichia coli]